MAGGKLPPKHVVRYYFTQSSLKKMQWKFECGVVREKKGTGYSNLISHIVSDHNGFEDYVRERRKQEAMGSVFRSTIVYDEARDVWAWLVFVVGDLEPFNTVELCL